LGEAFKAGFTNVSADLMLGIPGQTLEGLLEDGRKLSDLNVTHVSMYSLIIEEETPFYSRYKNIEDIVDPDLERRMYHELRDLLGSKGLAPYEISNCGKMSEHNMSYWKGMEYYAFGAGASGYLNGIRFSHPRSVKDYVKDPFHVDEEEKVGISGKMNEYMMLMLRTSDGPSKEEFQKRFKVSAELLIEAYKAISTARNTKVYKYLDNTLAELRNNKEAILQMLR
jgi:oxygen-independent coproporphyrinogen-3 oxidase